MTANFVPPIHRKKDHRAVVCMFVLRTKRTVVGGKRRAGLVCVVVRLVEMLLVSKVDLIGWVEVPLLYIINTSK